MVQSSIHGGLGKGVCDSVDNGIQELVLKQWETISKGL